MNFEAEFRDIKINLINGSDFDLTITDENKSRFKNELRFLKEICPNDIITGSLALNLYGLFNRQVRDIDVLIKDKDRHSIYLIAIDRYNLSTPEIAEIEESNHLGYIFLDYKIQNHVLDKVKKFLTSKYPIIDYMIEIFLRSVNTILNIFAHRINYTLDYFIDNGDNKFATFEFEGHTYKVHSLLNIISKKIEIMGSTECVQITYMTRLQRETHQKHKSDLNVIFSNLKYKDVSDTAITKII